MRKVTFHLLTPLPESVNDTLTYYSNTQSPVKVGFTVSDNLNKLTATGSLMALIDFSHWLGANSIPAVCEKVEDLETKLF